MVQVQNENEATPQLPEELNNKILEMSKISLDLLMSLTKIDEYLIKTMSNSTTVKDITAEAFTTLFTGLQLCKRAGIDPVNAILAIANHIVSQGETRSVD